MCMAQGETPQEPDGWEWRDPEESPTQPLLREIELPWGDLPRAPWLCKAAEPRNSPSNQPPIPGLCQWEHPVSPLHAPPPEGDQRHSERWPPASSQRARWGVWLALCVDVRPSLSSHQHG